MPSFFYAYSQEYCQIDPERIIAEPIGFGEYTLKPGQCMSYIGDGRPHRSIAMLGGFALEYAGYHDLVVGGGGCRLILFSVFKHPGFKQNSVYYCFRWLDKDNIFVIVAPLGGSRNIFPKIINFIEYPEAPSVGSVQMLLF